MKRFLCLASGCLALGFTLSSRALGQSAEIAVPENSASHPASQSAALESAGVPKAGAEPPEPSEASSGQVASAPVASASAPPKAVAGPLLLRVEGRFDDESRDALKDALVAELGCLVLLPEDTAAFAFRGTIDVKADESTKVLSVRYEDEAHEVTERKLESPESSEDRERMIVFVVGSLARGAAAEAEAEVDAAAGTGDVAKPVPEPALEKQFAHASLYYPIATNYGKPDIHTHFGFNLVYGRVGLLEGLSFGTYQVATRGVQGLEFALAANVTFGKAEGVQAAFVTNVAGDVDGTQVAFGGQVGIVNVAKKVRGVQFGLVNVSDEIEGVPIGLVNVSKGGGVHPIVWYSNHSYVNAGVKFATRYTYTFVNLAWNTDDYLIGPGFGFGGTAPIVQKRLFADVDVSETMLMPEGGVEGYLLDSSQFLSRLRVLARFQFLPHLGVFAGGGLAVKVERGRDETTGDLEDFAATALGELSAGVQF